jgi:anaerobic magnesium-protoporphyrin IX monomethyl ester cyclase
MLGRNSHSFICLIRPPATESFRFTSSSISLPLGLAYVAGALLNAGFEIKIVDAIGEGPEVRTKYCKGYLVGLRFEHIVERIPAETDVVGITVVFTHEWPAIVRLIDLIRARFPKAAIVLGGEHVTSLPEFSLLTSKADVAVLGEGEETAVELVRALRNRQPLAGIEGIAYRQGDAVKVNRRRERKTDIDSLAAPAWGYFALQTYRRNRFEGGLHTSRQTIPMLATRGCPYQCTYCSAPNMWLPRWIARDPIKVVDEIESHVREYGAGNFIFQDLTAIIQKSWIKTFCEELIRRDLNVNWQLPTGTRSEAIDSEVAHLLKRSGMTTMSYAPESGSDETRRLVKKKMAKERLYASVDAVVGAGINTSMFLVIGFPHDTHEHISENLPFLDELARRGAGDIGISFYMALPGTELFHNLYEAGRIKIDRAYFRHILNSLAPTPSQTYCALSRMELTLWKIRMLRRFYRAKKTDGGMAGALLRASRGILRRDGHQTKMETAVRHGMTTALQTIASALRPRYMKRSAERAMFASWDGIYRQIYEQKLACGAIAQRSMDPAELHQDNIIPTLVRDHNTARTITSVAG